MPLNIARNPSRIHGKVSVGCPVCGQKYTPREVSLPASDVGLHDLLLKRVISIPRPESPEQVRLYGELEMKCTACRVPFVHYEPVEGL